MPREISKNEVVIARSHEDIVGDLPSGEKTIDQWYNKLTFRKRKNNESPVTKTTFFE